MNPAKRYEIFMHFQAANPLKNWQNLRVERKARGANATVAPIEGGCSTTH